MKEVITAANAERMYEDVRYLANLGNRFAGSEAEHAAAAHVANCFTNSSFHVIKEDFPILTFYEEQAFIKIEDEEGTIPARAMFFSVATPPGGLEGELVFVGKGFPEDYAGKDVQGKIVIFHRDQETEKDQFWPEISTAARFGAKGAILINFVPWVFITTLETGFFKAEKRFLPIEPEPIPAIVINSTYGATLLKRMEEGTVKVRMVVDTKNVEGCSTNVRGIKKGTTLPEEKILVYGHRDSAGTPGANDNGSGTAIIMELARILADRTLKRTVELVSIGAEEQLGAAGSQAYIVAHRDELPQIKAAVEIDMVGAGSPLWVMEGGNWPDCEIRFPKKLCEYVMETAKELGYYLEYGFCSLGTPDSGRFAEAGVPTTWIWGPGDIYYHSPEDKPERVDPNKLKALADILATVICRLANAEEICW